MSETAYNLQSAEIAIEHTASVHFLDPNGYHSVETAVVIEPSLDYIVGNMPEKTLNEVAWIDFSSGPYASLKYNDSEIRRYFPAEKVGKTYFATDWHMSRYNFSSFDELTASDTLPLYCAEWLGRKFAQQSPNYRTDPVWNMVKDKRPFLGIADETPEAKANRLTNLLLHTRPDLIGRFVTRGIVERDDYPERLPMRPIELEMIRIPHSDLMQAAIHTQQRHMKYKDLTTGERRTPPTKIIHPNGAEELIPGTWLIRIEWLIKEIKSVTYSEGYIEIGVEPGIDHGLVIEQLEMIKEELLERRAAY